MLIANIISALSFISLSLFVISRNRKSQANILFASCMCLLAFSEASVVSIYLLRVDVNQQLALLKIATLFETLSLPCWFLFALAFAKKDIFEFYKNNKYFTLFWIAIPLLLFFFLPGEQFFYIESDIIWLGPAGKLHAIYTLLFSTLILRNLERVFRTLEGVFKGKAQVFLSGLGVLLSAYILKATIELLYSTVYPEKGYISLLFLLGSCLIGYSIVRHRLLDVDIFLSRYIVYSSVSLLAIGSFLLLVGIISGWISRVSDSISLIMLFALVASIVFAMVFNSDMLRYRVRVFINKNFFKYKHDFRDCWLEAVESITRLQDVNDVKQKVVSLIKFHLKAKSATFWSFKNHEYINLASKKLDRLNVDSEVLLLVVGKNKVINMGREWQELFSAKERKIFLSVEKNIQLFIPVKFAGAVLGVITVGENIIGDSYTLDDIDLAQAITRQGAAMIVNSNLTEQLVLAKEGEVFNHFSSFVIHDLKNFTQTLSLMMQNANDNLDNEEFLLDSFHSIGIIVNKMEKITGNLSSISGNMVLNNQRVEISGWLGLYLKMIKKVMPGCVVDMQVCEEAFVMLDTGMFEKVAHNFILNAMESKPGEVVTVLVSVYTGKKDVVVHFADNGAGMSEEFLVNDLFKPFRTTKAKGLGIGLFECKKIIETLNGTIGVESTFGEGTTIIVTLPLAGVLSLNE